MAVASKGQQRSSMRWAQAFADAAPGHTMAVDAELAMLSELAIASIQLHEAMTRTGHRLSPAVTSLVESQRHPEATTTLDPVATGKPRDL